MTRNDQALKVALAAAQQLPPKQQKQLAERLMSASRPDQSTVVVYLRQLSPQKQTRLIQLMDKHGEGRLNQAERLELQRLGSEVDQIVLSNSHALARALRPELFDERGRPMKRRFRQALGDLSFKRADLRQESV